MAFTGAWRRATRDNRDPERATRIHPDHATPRDYPDVVPETDRTGAPGLPTEWIGGQYEQPAVRSDYVDATPVDHRDGLGMLPGVDARTAQAVANAERLEDYGAASERGYVRPRYQAGGRRHVEMVSGDNAGASPETLVHLLKGVGSPIDPHARSNRRINRWTDVGPIDQHRWESQPRPRFLKTSRGSSSRPAVADRTQYVSPEGAGTVLRRDNWAVPVIRRAARPWDEAATVDSGGSAAVDFGLGSWGL